MENACQGGPPQTFAKYRECEVGTANVQFNLSHLNTRDTRHQRSFGRLFHNVALSLESCYCMLQLDLLMMVVFQGTNAL